MVRTTRLVTAIIALVNMGSIAIDKRDHAYAALFAFDLSHAVFAASIAIMMSVRPAPTTRRCELSFILAVVPFLVGIWLPQAWDHAHGNMVEPLLAHHFLLLGIAVGAPTLRTGIVMIATFTVHAMLMWFVLIRGAAPSSHDPWFTLFFAAVAIALMYTRTRRRDLERQLATAEERARTLTEVNAVLLLLRDRANTPLQTMELALSTLEEDYRDVAGIRAIRRAHDTLGEVQRSLSLRNADQAIELSTDLDSALSKLLGPKGPTKS
jgi:hypothetical protein